MVDETKDLCKQEQLSIAVSYIYVNKTALMERFHSFFSAKALKKLANIPHLRHRVTTPTTGKSSTQYIPDTLTSYNLDPQMIVSQGYDWAFVMSGSYSGVQIRIKEVAHCASYIHCHAYVLNLILVDCAKNNQHAAVFFTLTALYVIASTSKGHALFYESRSFIQTNSTFDSLIETLGCLAGDNDKAKAVEAENLLHQVHSFKFAATLIIFDRILSITKSLSDQLQAKNLDF
uniref:DUF4371 domain-containing protein n=1 Tax=Amphimedon queenslandica TaxID=400682 RepID=A0A1X7VRD7_AMPQE